MNNDNALFLITHQGDRHEDHIPWRICPLEKIKEYVTEEVYKQLQNSTDWITVDWFDTEEVKPEDLKFFEDVKNGVENVLLNSFDENVKDYTYFAGWAVTTVNLSPIILDQDNCCYFSRT